MNVSALTRKQVGEMAALHASGFSRPWQESDFIEHLANAYDHSIGVFDGEQLAGFLILRCQAPQSEILTVTVAPGLKRKGIAKALLAAAIARARAKQVEVIFLEVAADNNPAIALYEHAGFFHYAERPGYYKRDNGRVAAKLMQLSLHQ